MSSNAARPSTASASSGPASLSEHSTLPSPSPVVPPDTSPASSRSTSTPRAASAWAVAAPTIPAPTIATRIGLEREAGRERVGRVEQVLAHAGDPRAAGDLRHHGGAAGDLRLGDEPAREAGADHGFVHERLVQRQLAAGVQLGHAGARAGPARRAVEPAGVD